MDSEEERKSSSIYNNIVDELDQLLVRKPTTSDNKNIDSDKTRKHPHNVSSSTGVRELDVVLGGGFPKGAVVLLTGSSGSGKTILSFQWIFEGVKCGERGVYVTLTEPVFKLLENLEKL
ncbi:MAG: hypothetical protein DRN12_06635, partial [Thermoplasmata archaeon]